jgi:hypothetical protein
MKKALSRVVLVGLMATGLTLGSLITTNSVSCVSEDQHWCIWYADGSGNREGSSYVDLGGFTIRF